MARVAGGGGLFAGAHDVGKIVEDLRSGVLGHRGQRTGRLAGFGHPEPGRSCVRNAHTPVRSDAPANHDGMRITGSEAPSCLSTVPTLTNK